MSAASERLARRIAALLRELGWRASISDSGGVAVLHPDDGRCVAFVATEDGPRLIHCDPVYAAGITRAVELAAKHKTNPAALQRPGR